MMKLPQNEARQFSEFVENLPGVIEYGEKGVSNVPDYGVGSDMELQERARYLFESYTRSGQPVKMSECLRTAWKEINN